MWIATTVGLRLVVGVAVSAPVEVVAFFFSREALEGVPHGGGGSLYLPAVAAFRSFACSAVGGEERREERERQERSGVVLVVWYCTRRKEKQIKKT